MEKKMKENKNLKKKNSNNINNQIRKNNFSSPKEIKTIDVSPISKKDPFKTISSKYNKNEAKKNEKEKKKLKNKLKEKDDFTLKNIFIKSLKENMGNNFLDNNIDYFKTSKKKNDSLQINDSINSIYSNKSFLSLKSKSKFDSFLNLKEEYVDSLRNQISSHFEYSFSNYLKHILQKNNI